MISPRTRVLLGAALTAALAACLPATTQAARGVDLVGGYEWFDINDGATPGPGFWGGPTTVLLPPDDGALMPVTLPFSFPYYGGSSSNLLISDNGWVAFSSPGSSFPVAGVLPHPDPPNALIAPFWTDLLASGGGGRAIEHGEVVGQNAYRIQYRARNEATGAFTLFDLYLFADGRIKFHFLLATDLTTPTIGIDNGTGTAGFAIVDRGVPVTGVPTNVPAGYVIEILPPPHLASVCGLIPAIACGNRPDFLPGDLPGNVLAYSCNAATFAAEERVYSITLTEPSRVQATVTLGTATALRLFLLDACSERRCVQGPVVTLDTLLGPGTHYLVVDAATTANHGTFTLQLSCTPMGTPITCGDTVNDTTVGGSTFFATYPCAGPTNLSGPEAMYFIDVPSSTNLRATLTAGAGSHDVLVLAVPAGRAIAASDCVIHGANSVVLWGAPAGRYLVVVDGVSGGSGAFTLETECVVAMDCSTLAGTLDFTGTAQVDISDDTRGAPSNVDVYRCDLTGIYGGSELVYEINLPETGRVGVVEPGFSSGLSFFVLSDCNEGSCVGGATTCGDVLPAGRHYLVVDSAAGAEGAFFAQVVFEEPFGHWSDCEDPRAGTQPGDTVRTVWQFDDHDYCISDPDHRNHPDGCSFAMYVTARCGTEFHVPLHDVESGSVRIYDIFRQEYVDLDARSTGGWTGGGTHLQWEDCPGTDTRWNNQTTDISFERSEGLCGVYRIEFLDHAGFIWDLFANCTGDNSAGFPIYDSLCGALAGYDPLPDLSLVQANAVLNCPEITVTYTVSNIGCAPATDVTITLLDAGVPVATDLIGLVAPGETLTQTFTANFGGMSTSDVTLEVDATNGVVECEETPGAGCLLAPGFNEATLVDCGPPCDVVARGVATPPALCAGGTAVIDASSSTETGCPTGVLHYQLTGPGVTRPWQGSPNFILLSPTTTTDYDLDVRCGEATLQDSCVDSTTVRITVDVRPLFNPAPVTATEADCETAIHLSWDPATFRGPTGTGAYNVYRSTVSCADAVDLPSPTSDLVATAVPDVTYSDTTTTPGTTYFYVVEAEDATAVVGGCQPPGPAFGGATTRVDVSAGGCLGIVETDGTPVVDLPRVGNTLRLGAPFPYTTSTVTLVWGTDSPLDAAADEHYHVLRSDVPSGGFTQLNVPDPPLLRSESFTDLRATQVGPYPRLWFYLVFVANRCHADNRDIDRFTTLP